MADNNFNPNNDLSQFYQRSNKLANESNSLQLKVEGCYGCDNLELVGDFVVDSGAETVTFTAGSPTSGYDVRYFQIFIQDQSGNSASETVTGTALAAPVVVSTAALNVADSWFITVYFSTDKEVVLDHNCKTFGEIKVTTPAADPTVSVDTVTEGAAVINVFEADGSTAVPNDGADYALGDFAAGGTTEQATVIIKNTGASVLEITSSNVFGDVVSIATDIPNYVYVAGELTVVFDINTSGAAGAYNGQLELFNNDSTNSPFIINVAFNLV